MQTEMMYIISECYHTKKIQLHFKYHYHLGVRKAWTKEEEEEMKKYFKTYYDGTTKKTCPSRAECQRAIELSKNNGGYIHLRSWETIKKKLTIFFSALSRRSKNRCANMTGNVGH